MGKIGWLATVSSLLLGVVASPVAANAQVAVTWTSSSPGAFTLVGTQPVPVSVGSRIGWGVPVRSVDGRTICRTVGPISVGYRFGASVTSAAVSWAFNHQCEAIVTRVTTSAGQPTYLSTAPTLCRSVGCLPRGFVLAAEQAYEMFARVSSSDWLGGPVSASETGTGYVIRTNDDETQEIDGTDSYWTHCAAAQEQVLVRNIDCAGAVGEGVAVPEDAGIAEPTYGAEVRGDYTYLVEREIVQGVSYSEYAGVYDVAAADPGAFRCNIDGFYPEGWDDTCEGYVRG